ncbi:MAG: hypothetical protein WCJ55_03750 [Chloroflexales bacterium]
MSSQNIAPRPTTHWPYAKMMPLVVEVVLLILAAMLLTLLFQRQLTSNQPGTTGAPAPAQIEQVRDTWYLEK